MKFVDVPDSKRISKDPDDRTIIFSDGQIKQDGVIIKQIELLEYKNGTDKKTLLNPLLLISFFVR